MLRESQYSVDAVRAEVSLRQGNDTGAGEIKRSLVATVIDLSEEVNWASATHMVRWMF